MDADEKRLEKLFRASVVFRPAFECFYFYLRSNCLSVLLVYLLVVSASAVVLGFNSQGR